MTYCDFKVGDEVVCVNAVGARPGFVLYGHLVEGGVYTINRIGPNPSPFLDGVSLWLKESDNVCQATGLNIGYRPDRFRKVQKPKTDLSLEAFFTVPGGFEEPKRAPKAPAKKRERV
jgi:hypothetical protein